jgi:hypothetical protein
MSDEVERYRPEGAYAERHYAAIGKVAAEWAEFEFILDTRTLRLGAFDTKRGLCLTLQIIGPGRKLNAYMSIALLNGASDTTIKKLLKFQGRAFELAEKLNRVVHDQWMIFPSGSSHRFEATANKKLVMEYKEHPTESVDMLMKEIRSLILRFENLDEEVWNDIDTFHGKS